jgi:hypothetical protein
VPSLFVRDERRDYLPDGDRYRRSMPLKTHRSNYCERRVLLQNPAPADRIWLAHPSTTPNPPPVPLHSVQPRPDRSVMSGRERRRPSRFEPTRPDDRRAANSCAAGAFNTRLMANGVRHTGPSPPPMTVEGPAAGSATGQALHRGLPTRISVSGRTARWETTCKIAPTCSRAFPRSASTAAPCLNSASAPSARCRRDRLLDRRHARDLPRRYARMLEAPWSSAASLDATWSSSLTCDPRLSGARNARNLARYAAHGQFGKGRDLGAGHDSSRPVTRHR